MANELTREDLKHIVHPMTDLHALAAQGPRIITGAEGVYLIDAAGNRVIDGLSSLWNVNIGHGWKEIADTAQKQMATLDYSTSFFGMANEPSIRLASKLASVAPEGLSRVFFTNGGSEANESAFKIVRYAARANGLENKSIIVSRDLSYHGVSLGAMSATGIPSYHKWFGPLAPDFVHIPSPHCYRCPLGKTYGQCGIECADALDAVAKDTGPNRVNSVIVDPIQATGGIIVPPKEYMPRLREICDKHKINLIADEVITGFGRTGKWFAMAQWGVVPDMMTFAKGVTSGYLPLGGAVINESIYQDLLKAPEGTSFLHGFTYNGHPVCCAVGLNNIEIMEREKIVENARETGAYMQERLQELKSMEHVGDVRGMGLIAGVELVVDKATKQKFDPPIGARILAETYRNGLYARATGDTFMLAPPLTITRSQVDDVVRILREAIKKVIS